MSIKKNKLRDRFNKKSSESFININSSLENDKFLFEEDIEASIAHTTMLSSQKIISNKDSKKIISGLKKIRTEIKNNKFIFDDNLEDIHMNIESRLEELIGDAAERLHTGRSRNDQVVTDLKLWMKKDNILISKKLKKLKSALLQVASKNILITFPGLTHLQTAQPISVGHFFMAYFEMFNRDTNRFSDSFRRMNENPLGAGALAGTNFPINRNKTTKMLDFKKPTKNSLDTVSDRDFVVDFLFSSSLMAVHLSRLAEEITLYNSDLVGFFKIGDQLMSSSSIMPQKKNPDGAELIRAKSSTISGNLSSMLNLLKSLPLTYSKDLQEDKVLVTSTSKNIQLCLDCMIEIISTIKIEKSNIEKKLKSSYTNATDLADWLVRILNLPFRDAHHVTGEIVSLAERSQCDLSEIELKEMQKIHSDITEDVFTVLSIENSVKSRASYGGTSPEEVQFQVDRWKKVLG